MAPRSLAATVAALARTSNTATSETIRTLIR